IAVPEARQVPAGCLAYVSNLDGNEELFIINTDGTNPINLTNTHSYESYPKWSPDGTKLAFTSDR
ncbi:MAG: hypothetical protein GWN20_13550, partial [Phycisphaerae bacterium]|nr:hypothetical protein [Phycisphaerae bacterium]